MNEVGAPIDGLIKSLPPLIQMVVASNGKRVSETIEHTTMPIHGGITEELEKLQISNPEAYDFIVREGVIIDLGAGESIPHKAEIQKIPVRFYVAIDLCYDTLVVRREGDSTIIEKPGDFFSVLEGLPDGSVPCFYLQLIDVYILNGEGKKLQELLRRKIHPKGTIFTKYC